MIQLIRSLIEYFFYSETLLILIEINELNDSFYSFVSSQQFVAISKINHKLVGRTIVLEEN